jgi:hypothetical protein
MPLVHGPAGLPRIRVDAIRRVKLWHRDRLGEVVGGTYTSSVGPSGAVMSTHPLDAIRWDVNGGQREEGAAMR